MSKAPFRGNSTPRDIHQVSRLARRHTPASTAASSVRTVVVGAATASGGVSVADPLIYTGGAIALPSADAANDGYLTAPDWNLFSGKEPSLGAPASDGQVLASTAAAARSWVSLPTVPSFADSETPAGAVNGTNAAFTLAHVPVAGSLHLYKGASATAMQRLAPSQYTITGGALTLVSAPATGSALLADYRY